MFALQFARAGRRGGKGEVADAAEHEAAVSPACFLLREERDMGEKPSCSLSPSEASCRRSPSGAAFPAPAFSLLQLRGSVS